MKVYLNWKSGAVDAEELDSDHEVELLKSISTYSEVVEKDGQLHPKYDTFSVGDQWVVVEVESLESFIEQEYFPVMVEYANGSFYITVLDEAE